MNISKAASYGIVGLTYIAENQHEGLVTAAAISENKDIPKSFLHKILRQLEDNGIIRSKKGPSGGYSLTLPADKISILTVIEAIQGPLFFKSCLLGGETCNDEVDCKIHNVWVSTQEVVKSTLDAASIASLTE